MPRFPTPLDDKASSLTRSVLFALWLFATPALGQEDGDSPSFHVRTWSVEQGLPQVAVENVIRSRSGAVWLTCDTGLLRFDGTYFEPVPLGIRPGDGIVQLVDDPTDESLLAVLKSGELFVIPWAGQPRRVPLGSQLGRLRQVAVPASASDRSKPDEDAVSGVIGTFDDGFACIDLEDGALSICECDLSTGEPGFGQSNVKIATDGHGVWMARGRTVYHGRAGGPLGPAGELEEPCTGIEMPEPWGLWLLTENSLYHVNADFDSYRVELSQKFGTHSHLHVDGDTIWIGTRDFGLLNYRFDESKKSARLVAVFGQQSGLAGYSIRALEPDLESGVWVGTVLGGFSLVRPRDGRILRVDTAKDPKGDDFRRFDAIFGVLAASDGTLFGGTRRSGLWRTDAEGELRAVEGVSGLILALREGPEGRIWAGGWSGVYFGSSTGAFTKPVSSVERVQSIETLPDGTIWAAAGSGLFHLGLNDDELEVLDRRLEGQNVWVVRSLGGRLHAGTLDGRLFRMSHDGAANDGELEEVDLGDAVESGITDLHWHGNRLWIADEWGGLSVLDEGSPRRLGLSSISPIHCLGLESSGDNLCLATTRGVLTFDPEIVLARDDGEVQGSWTPVSAIGAIELNGFGGNATSMSSDGRMYLASVAGLASIRPKPPEAAPHEPRIVLQSIVTDHALSIDADEPVCPTDTLEIGYRIDYWSASQDVTHETRLVGLSSEWTPGPDDRRIRFDKLPPGDYEFQVRARSAGHSWGAPASLYAFTVPVPFIETGWFYGSMAVLLAAVALSSFRWTRRREAKLQRMVATRTAQLRRQIDLKERAEVELRTHRDELDDQVRQRTEDLATANERLRIELEERHRLQDELVRAQKLEGVARLAGGLAHDLNNLLTAIVCSSELARASVPSDSIASEDLESAQAAAHRASQLTRRLLTFAKPQPLREETFDLNSLVSSSFRILRSAIPESIALVFEPAPGPCWTRTDPRQLEQVIMNLVLNASQAIDSNGRIELSVETEVEGRPGMVTLITKDDGCGMTPEVLARARDPFFSTKADGTGLGLPVCADILERAGGELEILSEASVGTTVRVLLPRSENVAPRPEPGRVRSASKQSSLRLLLVEDQDSLRSALQRSLRAHGHEVLTASHGAEAESVFDREQGRIDALITDLVMPNLSGAELIRSLRTRRPRLPAILMTGYTPEHLDASVDSGPTAWLPKPFTPSELIDALDRLFDEHAPNDTRG